VRIVLQSMAHAKRLSRSLMEHIPGIALATAQAYVARMLGYRDLHELQQVTGTEPASAPDEDCAPDIVSARRHYQAQQLAAASGTPRDRAASIVVEMRPSSSRLASEAVGTIKTFPSIQDTRSEPETQDQRERRSNRMSGQEADAILADDLAFLRSIGRPSADDILSMATSFYGCELGWFQGNASRDARKSLRELPFALGWYFHDLRSYRWVAERDGGSEFSESDLYDVALHLCASGISEAYLHNEHRLVEVLLRDADQLMTCAAEEGNTTAITKIATRLLETEAPWLELPSNSLDEESPPISNRGNLILWQVAALARAGDRSHARRRLHDLTANESQNPDVDIIRRALVAAATGQRGEEMDHFMSGLTELDGPGLLYLLDQFNEQVVDSGASSVLAYMSEGLASARTAQFILTASSSASLLGELDLFLLQKRSNDAEEYS
jgi:hypothetical protein